MKPPRSFLSLLLGTALLLSGCAETPPPVPSLRVVDAACRAQAIEAPTRPPAYRLYATPEGWLMQPVSSPMPLVASARATQILAATEEAPPAGWHPSPLPQEMQEELARLRRLVAENEAAMSKMEESSQALSAAARELMRRVDAVREEPVRIHPSPTPTPGAARRP